MLRDVPISKTGTVSLDDIVADRKPRTEAQNAEADSEKELSELLQDFRAKARTEDKRRAEATDGEFYSVVVFPSKRMRDAFMDAVGAAGVFEEEDLQYVDGVAIAAKLGVELPTPPKLNRRTNRTQWNSQGVIWK